jgi:signal transduction histidine kinase
MQPNGTISGAPPIMSEVGQRRSEDNGIGISETDLGRIWRIFERGHEHKRYEGTGVGLSWVKRAVERMGGRVGSRVCAWQRQSLLV